MTVRFIVNCPKSKPTKSKSSFTKMLLNGIFIPSTICICVVTSSESSRFYNSYYSINFGTQNFHSCVRYLK